MTRDAMGHDEAMALLPWLANDTLAADERERVERHVRQCLPCRAELTGQRALQAQVRRQPAVPISAERDFERLQRRIDAAAAPRSSLFNVSRRTAWAAAAVVIASLAAVLALVPFEDSLREDRVAYNALTESVYGALTDPAEHALIDVIFANGVTEAEMRALLAELGAEIIAGPSPRLGRYTLRLESIARVAGSIGPLDVDAAIERLQSDRRVRFASRGFSPPAAAQGPENQRNVEQ